jgi:hypothetical protein
MKQKTKILTLMVFGLLFSNLSAQENQFKDDPIVNTENENNSFRLGLQFNPNISWLSPNSAEYKSDGSKFSFAYGLSTEFFLTKNYLFSTGLFISSLGGEVSYEGIYEDYTGNNIASSTKQSYNIKYLEIPLTLKLRTNEIGYLTYYGNFGLKSGIKLQSNSDFTYSDINNLPKVKDINTSSDIYAINLYLTIGAGIEYNLSGNTNLMLGVTFNNGFINQLDKKLNVIDNTGKAALDASGNPILSKEDASANLNYFALNVGLYF